uniref:Zinc finger CCCH-type containing 7A n=1 Tax=Myripristis murdjan TaxID=586833 RepID=A0A668AVX9_9TELE
MSGACKDRRSRWQDIQKGLQFIQSTLPFPGTQDQYEVFIQELVWNLFGEGNDVFKEGEWTKAVEMYTEALSIADYADSEDISIPTGLLEKLFANRAAAYLNIGLFDQALEDCEKALHLNEGNYRALFRKAKALKELGRHQEAYEAVAKCSLVVPQVRFNICSQILPQLSQDSGGPLPVPVQVPVPVLPSLNDAVLDDIPLSNSISSLPSSEPPSFEPVPLPVSVPTSVSLPAPTMVNGSRTSKPCPLPESSQDYDAEIIGDDLDDLLDQAGPPEPAMVSADMKSISTDSPMGMAVGMPDMKGPAAVDLAKNPLAETHEFKQACSLCFVKTGPGVLDYTLHTEEHKCKKDALLGRLKHLPDKTWKLIRPRPTKNQYVGPYYICKEVAVGQECLYPGHCTFAYCQEEIDVWTLERKGFISRELLFDPFRPNCNVRLTVPKILQEHRGIFMFLCGVCFDHKPRIISKTNKDNPSLCSHPVTKHDFEDHKCLVHILKENTVRYSKIRPLNLHCQLDLCRHEVRYGCVREDDCFYAHSLIELKVWMMQHELGITHENIVQEAKKYWSTAASLAQRRFGPPNLKMMFVCGQCWRNGQLSEADKNKKYCSAKARHTWSKDRRVVLVSSNERKKWTTVRPLPTKKPIPSQFEICMHVTAGKKCQYIGNCTFAHSIEERDLWTYMKENNIPDMDQLYEQWLLSQKPGWGEEASNSSIRENGKQIHMPTDYAEEVAGNHCWLCGKNCNSDKQWQQHITSEKHKEKVFNSEDDQNCWQYRFPTGTFKVCERFLKGTCTEDDSCKLAHGNQELKEWMERREFLLLKLAKARKDHLIAPNDNDFGKYSFLMILNGGHSGLALRMTVELL